MMPLSSERVIVPTMTAGNALLDGYEAGFHPAVETSPQDFGWINRDDLLRRGRMLAVHSEDGIVTAGFYYDRDEDARGPYLYLQGLFSNALVRGSARALVAHAILHESERTGQPSAVKTTVRVRPDGQVNPDATRFFAGLGFRSERFRETQLRAASANRHLLSTANRDAQGRPYVRVLDQYLPAREALQTACDILDLRRAA